MLVDPDGCLLNRVRIVSEEWLRARPDAGTVPPDGLVDNPTVPEGDYPLRIAWNAILVDDSGFSGTQPHQARHCPPKSARPSNLLWQDKAYEIEQEACGILGVSDLRDYFRRPSGFFQDHLKRYSMSRRKAPIYWPLSTASGSIYHLALLSPPDRTNGLCGDQRFRRTETQAGKWPKWLRCGTKGNTLAARGKTVRDSPGVRVRTGRTCATAC